MLCGLFCSFIRPSDFDTFIRSTWSLPWKFGDYHRTTFTLNPLRHARLQNKSELSTSYSMKAVQIQGVPPEAAVYITTPDSMLESNVFASESVHNTGQTPIFFTPIGDGFLGYIGDVNAETGSTAVILAMCNLMSDGLNM